MTDPILPGAEPWSAPGGPNGALVLHGFTGSPHSMRGLAEALAGAGFGVELPLLPGHGTSVDDMLTTSWDDWSAAAEAAYQRLVGRCPGKVIVTGLSMGGTLTLWLAERHPEIAGIALVNAAAQDQPGLRELAEALLAGGDQTMDGIGSDIADPDSTELAYDRTPLLPLESLADALPAVSGSLGSVQCPTLVLNSPQDHVVPPGDSDAIAAGVSGPVERVTLERSFHVATLDYDKDLINQSVVDFANKVTAG
ncbi:MAG TPA: alpha/beta fold hydrolase [Acidimicrobiales bacterium]|jgi:carboxylesterase|nr:alpha/beta fold hydrolase [Acidimicrobiales bacterium]